jgi:crotonobetainyl-CoA:carnitine CoA-transferase CaiB-like acyl-CoA transferase
MDDLGIGYADLSATNPGITMAASQLMGSRGLWANWRGYGPSTQAPGGLSYLWSYEGDDAPAGTASIFPDHFVGRLCAVGALATLIGRRRGTVQGGLVEVAQCEAVTGVLSDLLAAESVEPGSVGPRGIHTERGTPGGMYRCAGEDEWVAITCRDDADWAALAGLLGKPELADDLRFATLDARRAAVDEVDGLVGSWTGGLDRFEAADRCQAAGVPAGAMLHSRDLASNEHLVARGFPVPVDQPAVGTILFEGPAFFGPAIAPPVEEPAPWLGEHTEEIAIELLGLDPAEVQRLIDAGVLEITPLDKRPG